MLRNEHFSPLTRKSRITIVQNYNLVEGAIILDLDIREYFPDAESVNHALRTLINLIPKKA